MSYTEIEVPDDMDVWDFMKQRRQQRKATRLTAFNTEQEARLKNHKGVTDYKRCTAWHVQFNIQGDKYPVNYYPSTAKWVHNNRVMHGNFESLMGWLGKRTRRL